MSAYTFLVGKYQGKGPHGKQRHGWVDAIDLGITGCIGVSDLASTASA
jgi:hypothetical protein